MYTIIDLCSHYAYNCLVEQFNYLIELLKLA